MKNNFIFSLITIFIFSFLQSCISTPSNGEIIKSTSALATTPILEPTLESTRNQMTEEGMSTLIIDQVVEMPNFGKFNLKAILLYDEFEVNNIIWQKKDGLKRVVFIFGGKNLTTEDLTPVSFLNVKLIYNDKYTYTPDDGWFGYGYYVRDGYLKPLFDSEIYCVVEIPDEVADGLEEVKTIITINDQEFQYLEEIEKANEYINQIQEIYSELENIGDALDAITMEMNFTFSPTKEDLIGYSNVFSEQKSLVDNLVNRVSVLTPPGIYKVGHANFLEGITGLHAGLEFVSIEITSDDISIYRDNFIRGGEQIQEAGLLIERAKEELEFLNW